MGLVSRDRVCVQDDVFGCVMTETLSCTTSDSLYVGVIGSSSTLKSDVRPRLSHHHLI
jgi:hypothetical protein